MYVTSFAFDSIVVIESLPRGDLRSGRELFEGTIASVSLADPGFVSELYEPRSRQAFLGSLRAVKEMAQRLGRSPIVHFETHGGKEGIELADGELIVWSDIADALAAINQISRMNLVVVAAMCHGWHMIDILRPIHRAPAFGIVGIRDTISAGDLLERMQAFYGVLLRSHDLRAALNEANGTGDIAEWNFEMLGAEVMLCRVFSHYVESLRTEETQSQRLNRMVADVARAQNLDVRGTMIVRDSLGRALDNHVMWFGFYRSRFLMLDLFPENASRFPLTYADCAGDSG